MGLHTHGTILSGATMGTIGKITNIAVSGINRDAIDVSDCDTEDKYRDYEPGMIDPGEISGTIRFDKTMFDTLGDGIESYAEEWTITYPDNPTMGSRSKMVANGFLTVSNAIAGEFQGDITADFTIKLSGKPVGTFS